MKVTLTATWRPRGELPRLRKLLPWLRQVYETIILTLPPVSPPEVVAALRDLAQDEPLRLVVTDVWSHGRYRSLAEALDAPAGTIQYADLDRLLRWAETRPQELLQAVDDARQHDCLIFGRTQAAYRSHPQALYQTEAISNRVVSQFLDHLMDVSAGSKAFSRAAAEFLVAHTVPGHPFGVDAEWPILLQRAGFQVDYLEVDGLDWESADRYQERAASSDGQAQAAQEYDRNPEHWQARVVVAQEIVEWAMVTAQRSLPSKSGISDPRQS
jgi:hypothetical protein